jgi:hypothetical protein
MITPTPELRNLTLDAIRACAGIVPFALGSGRDSHGAPVPDADRVLRDALQLLAHCGRDAQRILNATRTEEIVR